jgi:phosphoribosyl 1,2-cyclic phosphate phosphodiesterase
MAEEVAPGALTITFLGTGTSVGVPMVGCDCAVCHSDDPRDRRFRSSILITTPEAQWVVDTGPDFRSQCLRAGIRRLDAVLLTHAHTDHVAGFDDLRRFTVGADQELEVYASASCLAAVRRMFEFAFNGENRYPGYFKPLPRPFDGPFRIGGTEITPLPVDHGKVETHGFLFCRGGRKLVAYLPDLKSAHPETLVAIADVEALVVDALRFTPHPTHLNFEEALALAREVGARRTWFTHFQCQVGHAEAEEKLPPDVRLAYDGLVLALPLI